MVALFDYKANPDSPGGFVELSLHKGSLKERERERERGGGGRRAQQQLWINFDNRTAT